MAISFDRRAREQFAGDRHWCRGNVIGKVVAVSAGKGTGR